MKRVLLLLDHANCDDQIALATQLVRQLDVNVTGLYLKNQPVGGAPDRVAALAAAGPVPVVQAGTLDTMVSDDEIFIEGLQLKLRQVKNPSGKAVKLIVSALPLEKAVLHHGLYQDLLVVSKDIQSTDMMGLIHDGPAELAAQCRRPIFALPKGTPSRVVAGDALVIWHNDPETAAAISHAVPLLQCARSVTVLFAEGRAEYELQYSDLQLDVMGYLAEQAIVANALQAPAKPETSDTFVGLLVDGNFDYAVAGAQSHSKIRELLAGNVLRDVLKRTQVPLLLAA